MKTVLVLLACMFIGCGDEEGSFEEVQDDCRSDQVVCNRGSVCGMNIAPEGTTFKCIALTVEDQTPEITIHFPIGGDDSSERSDYSI